MKIKGKGIKYGTVHKIFVLLKPNCTCLIPAGCNFMSLPSPPPLRQANTETLNTLRIKFLELKTEIRRTEFPKLLTSSSDILRQVSFCRQKSLLKYF